MILNSPINMKHRKCAVYTDRFYLIINVQAIVKTIFFITTSNTYKID